MPPLRNDRRGGRKSESRSKGEEATSLFDDELEAYQEHSQQYFDEWKELLEKHHNIERLVSEWKNILGMCEGHVAIAERFYQGSPGCRHFKRERSSN